MKGVKLASQALLAVVAAVFVTASSHASAATAPVALRFGFCVAEFGGRCVEVALPGAVLDYESLPEDENGRRYLRFYSSLAARSVTALAHVLHGEDQDQSVEFATSDPESADVAAVRDKLAEILLQCEGPGSTVVTAFSSAEDGSRELFVFSRIPVAGPGQYSGCAVTIEGKLAATTEKISLSVIRRPSTH